MQVTDLVTLLNPVVYTIMMIVMLYGGSIFIIKYVVRPQEKKHKEETTRLREERRQYGILMNDLSPIAVLQTDSEGKLIFWNSAGGSLLKVKWEEQSSPVYMKDIDSVFAEISLAEIIAAGITQRIECKIESNFYIVEIKGVPGHGFAHVCFLDISAIKEQERLLKEYHEKIRRAQEEEREKLAKSLHDSHGQSLTSVRLMTKRMLEKSGMDKEQEKMLKLILAEVDQSIDEVHEIVHELKPKLLNELGLTVALNAMVKKLEKSGMLKGEFQTNINEKQLSSELEIIIYRMMQELLNNILKHAKAESFMLQLMSDGASITIILSDDGVGMPVNRSQTPTSKGGWGLYNLEDQIKYLDGRMEIISAPGEGTEFVIEFPIKREEEKV